MTWKVLETDYVWPTTDPERAVLEAGGAELVTAPDSEEDTLAELARDADGIMTCFAPVTEKVVRAAERCVVIGRLGVGVDNIAVATATELGIAVTNVPDYCVDEVSDHVMALLHTWNRKVALLDRSVRDQGWGSVPLTMRMMRLRGKTIGIIGFGRIGQGVAAKARAFGLNILAYGPRLTQEKVDPFGGRRVELETLLKESDFVSVNAPLTQETEGMIGKAELNLMKPEAYLINTARGALIDESALYEALTTHKIAGAGLDVMTGGVPAPDNPLIGLDNIIITPHVAFFSQESTVEMEERAAEAVVNVLQGKMPGSLVNPAVLQHPNPRHKLPRR